MVYIPTCAVTDEDLIGALKARGYYVMKKPLTRLSWNRTLPLPISGDAFRIESVLRIREQIEQQHLYFSERDAGNEVGIRIISAELPVFVGG